MNIMITPVLLSGGSGERLWPLSRKSFPKQFSEIIGGKSLFQRSSLRLISSDIIKFSPIITLTNTDFRFIVSEQLQDVGINPGPIIIEPESKNTAPAILAASIFASKKNKEAIIIIAPADHIIEDVKVFHKAIFNSLSAVNSDKIVTLGIKPTHAETGYGYLEYDKNIKSNLFDVIKFVEKPNIEKARTMFQKDNYLWNSGIFIFKANVIIKAFQKLEPQMTKSVFKAIQYSSSDLGFLKLNSESWKECTNISIDYAIMEKQKNISVIPLFTGWSDLGDWQSVWKTMKPDQNGLALSKNAHALNCKNTLLRSENENQKIVGLDLENIIAIAMQDAVLIAKKDKSQNVKLAVQELKKQNILQAEVFPKDYRPWGWFEVLATSNFFQVKRILVNPGAALSLQSHKYRSEHWIVVEGKAKVTIEKNIQQVKKGQSVFVPLGAIHRLENLEKIPLILIEVQTGTYLGEDDIYRYEDKYSRIH
jgi:mannose-1-phosphate guanylyltransferase/mannose-6-phosphate isomerase